MIAAVALATATGLAACGDDDSAQRVSIEVSKKGEGSQITGAPETLEAGLVDIKLTNSGDKTHDWQLIRVEGDHSPAEVVQGAGQAIQGKPFPDWFFAGGGVGPTEPGESQTVSQVLEPGTYYAFDIEGSEGPPDPESVTSIEVTGDPSEDELDATDATIRTIDYGFETSGELKAGENEITFENAGAQPHHIIATPFVEGKGIEDLRQALKREKGPPPIDEKDEVTTAVLEGGDSQVVTLNLKQPGKYALLCFISDREGGPPHSIADGMIGEAEVG